MSAKLMKPTVNIKAKNPTFAMYGHILALLASVITLIFGLLHLFGGAILSGLVTLIFAIIIIVVELDTVSLAPMKDALTRGIIWLIFAIVGAAAGDFSNLLLAISGILYLVYHFK